MRYEHKKAHAFLMRFLSRRNVDICYNKVALEWLSFFSSIDKGDFAAIAMQSAKCPSKNEQNSTVNV